MIISASRRTDVPCYFSEWFFNSVREGFVLTRNPMNARCIRRVDLSPDAVDAFVFWTKNPRAMIDNLHILKQRPFYFQFTLNAYAQDIETGLPSKYEIIDTFKMLSERIGAHRTLWRYDPILLNDVYTVDWHIENFALIARQLKGHTGKATVSFMDFYSKIKKNVERLKIREMTLDEKYKIIKHIAMTAKENGLELDVCAEDIDLAQFGAARAKCIDERLVERISGRVLNVKKDRSQRPACGCAASVDIGVYNTCLNGCKYCYATYSKPLAQNQSDGCNRPQ
jgi:DNA repair photolyase